jgi:hypothetical protein
MKFRLKAFGWHLLGSSMALSIVLGGLYLGWYRWPGWYLTGVVHVASIFGSVDLTLGPLVTLLIANPKKPRGQLARDIAIIATIQLCALVYGAATLWSGRPLYYTFSADRLETVHGADVPSAERELARSQNPQFAPYWYSLPRWVWAKMPEDEATRNKIITSAVAGGDDVIDMPRYFKPWEQASSERSKQLKRVDELLIFTKPERKILKERMTALGLPADQPIGMYLIGSDRPLLAVFDPAGAQIKALIRPD